MRAIQHVVGGVKRLGGNFRIVWVGFHDEGVPTLESLLSRDGCVVGAVTLTSAAGERRSGVADIAGRCRNSGVPVLEVENINDPSCIDFMHGLDPDLVVVLGWSQILSAEVLDIPRVGVLGSHASVLPHNRGSAPVNWAIIRGETHGGNTLMWLSKGIDNGDIVAQKKFPILETDTCATIYEKVALTNREMVLDCLGSLAKGVVPRRPQESSDEPLLPRRRPADGAIDWRWPAKQVYDFVRAITRPYPGAFTHQGGVRIQVWETALVPGVNSNAAPGTVLGSLTSPNPAIRGCVVACGSGVVVLTDFESDGWPTDDRQATVLPEGVVLG